MAPTAHPRPNVISFVARSNTGKTTLIESLVPELQKHGVSVGVLKHHSHAGLFDVPGKDTYRIAAAGADVVVGVSPVQTAVFTAQEGPYDLEAALDAHLADVDIILVEGYKRGPYRKVEVHRAERSEELLCEPDELVALVSDAEWDIEVPRFGLDDIEDISRFLVELIESPG